jgi:cytochrome c553
MNKTRPHFSVISMSLLLLTSSGVYAADVLAGKVTATQCAICHGVNGEGNGIPGSNIAGMDADKFKKHLRDFKSGARKNVMMERFAKRLSDQDIENLAAYFAPK